MWTIDVKPYTTRIYPICVGSDGKHFEFLEYLARNTRGFGIRIHSDDFLQFDIRNFLDSIKSPFLTFDDPNMNDQIFNFSYFGGDTKRASQLIFPFRLPDLYLDRPLVLKCYIECGKPLIGISINGVHLININRLETQFIQSKVVCTIDESINNDKFPMELILANEELDYWNGDYLFKLNNKILQKETSVIDNNDPFLRVALTSNDTKYTEKILKDLGVQTGMYTLLTNLVSFCMTLDRYNGYEKSKCEQKIHWQKLIQFLAQKKYVHLVENNHNNIGMNNNNYNNNNNYSNYNALNRQYDNNLRTMVQSNENIVNTSQEKLIYPNNPNERFEMKSATGTSVINGMNLSEYESKIREIIAGDRIVFDSGMKQFSNNNRRTKNSNDQASRVVIKAHILQNINPRAAKLMSKVEILTALGLFWVAGTSITFVFPEPINFVLFDDTENDYNDGKFACGKCCIGCCKCAIIAACIALISCNSR